METLLIILVISATLTIELFFKSLSLICKDEKFSYILNGSIIIILICLIMGHECPKSETIIEERIVEVYPPDFLYKNVNDSLFLECCKYYDIQDAEWVLAQAHLESGHFKSDIYKEKNNCLGLYDSKNKTYFSFEHWSDCIKGYKTSVEYKKLENENHLDFLTRIHYAEDPSYINKVNRIYKVLVKQ